MPQMNKQNSLGVQARAYDIVRQGLWRAAEVTKEESKKKAIERQLVSLDDSLYYNYAMLHDIIQGKDAKFICKIKPDGQVLMGHEHQAVYFTLDWDDIHRLSADIKEFEKELAAEKDQLIAKNTENLKQIKEMLQQRLITKVDADRYLKEMFGMPEHVTASWLKDHVITDEEHERMALKQIYKDWEKKHQVKSPKVLS